MSAPEPMPLSQPGFALLKLLSQGYKVRHDEDGNKRLMMEHPVRDAEVLRAALRELGEAGCLEYSANGSGDCWISLKGFSRFDLERGRRKF